MNTISFETFCSLQVAQAMTGESDPQLDALAEGHDAAASDQERSAYLVLATKWFEANGHFKQSASPLSLLSDHPGVMLKVSDKLRGVKRSPPFYQLRRKEYLAVHRQKTQLPPFLLTAPPSSSSTAGPSRGEELFRDGERSEREGDLQLARMNYSQAAHYFEDRGEFLPAADAMERFFRVIEKQRYCGTSLHDYVKWRMQQGRLLVQGEAYGRANTLWSWLADYLRGPEEGRVRMRGRIFLCHAQTLAKMGKFSMAIFFSEMAANTFGKIPFDVCDRSTALGLSSYYLKRQGKGVEAKQKWGEALAVWIRPGSEDDSAGERRLSERYNESRLSEEVADILSGSPSIISFGVENSAFNTPQSLAEAARLYQIAAEFSAGVGHSGNLAYTIPANHWERAGMALLQLNKQIEGMVCLQKAFLLFRVGEERQGMERMRQKIEGLEIVRSPQDMEKAFSRLATWLRKIGVKEEEARARSTRAKFLKDLGRNEEAARELKTAGQLLKRKGSLKEAAKLFQEAEELLGKVALKAARVQVDQPN